MKLAEQKSYMESEFFLETEELSNYRKSPYNIEDKCLFVKEDKIPVELLKIINNILSTTDLPKKNNKTIRDLIKNGKYGKAIAMSFLLLWKSILGGKNETWLKNLKYLDNEIEKSWLCNVDNIKLEKYIDLISNKIDEVSDFKKKIKLAYLLSYIKNKFIDNEISEKKHSKREFLKQNLLKHSIWDMHTGKILLINKVQNKSWLIHKMWDKLLAEYNKKTDNDIRFLHSVVISKIEWWEIYITHATLSRNSEKNHKPWIEEIKLETLLDEYISVDILVLDMPEQFKQNTLDYVNEKRIIQLNTKKSLYDKKAAISSVLPIIKQSNNKFNCVGLIAQWIWEEKIKNISHPNDFLQSDIMKPIYLTTF